MCSLPEPASPPSGGGGPSAGKESGGHILWWELERPSGPPCTDEETEAQRGRGSPGVMCQVRGLSHGIGSDVTERLHFHFSLACIGGGNGNPLQCSCLENPRDGGAWWAAVCGVAQSRTRLK